MMKRSVFNMLIIMVLLALTAAPASSMEPTGITYTYSSPSQGDYKGEASQHEVKAAVLLPIADSVGPGVKVTLNPFFQGNFWRFTDSDYKELNLYKINLPVGLGYRVSDKVFTNLEVIFGLHSDLKKVNNDDFRREGALTGTYVMNPETMIILGLAYGDEFGDPRLYPVGGIKWQPSNVLTLDILFPKPRISYAMNPDLRLFVAGEPAGGQWNIREDGEDWDLQFKGFRVGTGTEYQAVSRGWLFAMVGIETNRELQFVQHGHDVGDPTDLDDNYFIQVGFRIQ